MKKFKFIWELMPKVKIKQILVFFVVSMYVVLTLLSPLLFSFLIDNVINGDTITNPIWVKISELAGGVDFLRDNLWIGAVAVVVIGVGLGLCVFFRGKMNSEISETVAQNLRNKVYDHLQLLPYSYHVKAKTGDLIQRCTSDVDTVRRFLAGQLAEMVYSVLIATFAITILFSLNVKLAWIACSILPVIFLIAFLFFKRMQKVFGDSDEAEGVLSTTIQENLAGLRVVKAFNRENYEIEKMDKHNIIFRDLTYKVIKNLGMYWGGSDLVCLTQILIIILFGISEAQAGNLSIGNFFVFITYQGMILWPMRGLGRNLSEMGRTTVSIGRLQEIVDVPIEDTTSGEVVDLKGDIIFDDVCFQYDDGDTNVIENISFKVKQGTTVAIMGPTGSGKSSLIHLLTRLYDATSGKITINGYDITTIQKKWLRKNVGTVLQEPFLFSRSIYENIKIANQSIEREKIIEAAQVASVHTVIEEFDKGYDTLVGEKGVTLSGGQKQRIAIARTVLNESPILIFDDSLSAVDTETDSAIREGLNNVSNDLTTFIITQRVASAQNADMILILENKKITQMGTHVQLVAQDGLYKRIYEIQTAMQKAREQ